MSRQQGLWRQRVSLPGVSGGGGGGSSGLSLPLGAPRDHQHRSYVIKKRLPETLSFPGFFHFPTPGIIFIKKYFLRPCLVLGEGHTWAQAYTHHRVFIWGSKANSLPERLWSREHGALRKSRSLSSVV